MSIDKKNARSEKALYIPKRPERNIAPENIPLLISYPKSGRTWIRYIFALVDQPLEASHAGCGVANNDVGKEFLSARTSMTDNRSCLFMHRNPIDTAISYYFQVTRRDFRIYSKRYIMTFPRLYFENRLPPRDLMSFLRHPGYGVEKTCKFNRSWLDYLSRRTNTLIFSYEDIKLRPEQTLSKVFRFNGVEQFDVDWILHQSSFASMQAVEKSGRAHHLALRQKSSKDPDSAKLRRGKVLGYQDYLDQESIQYFQDLCRRYGIEA